MIRPKFPTKEELLNMPVKQIRGLNINDPEEEALIQAVLDILIPKTPLTQVEVYDLDIKGMEIKTPEQERKLQVELDRRREGAAIVSGVYTKEEVLESNIEKIEKETAKIEEELKEEGVEEIKAEDNGIKCDLCGTRGFRHKKGCPTLINE